MKKITVLLGIILVALLISVPCFAQYYSNDFMGIGYHLDDAWVPQGSNGNMDATYSYKGQEHENIYINVGEVPGGTDISQLAQSKLREMCEGVTGDAVLARKYSELNGGKNTYVNTESVLDRYETYNGVTYYRYEKAFTITGPEYIPSSRHNTLLITMKNEKIYIFEYVHDYTANHYAQFVNMLNTMTFGDGEIRIFMNGDRVYPDSAPILVNDRTMVPIRVVAEKMGYKVEWYDKEQAVKMTSPDGKTSLVFGIGTKGYIVADNTNKTYKEVAIDIAAMLHNNRTYLPLRAVAEAMHTTVQWDGTQNAVIITY